MGEPVYDGQRRADRRYKEARARLDSLATSPVQEEMDRRGDVDENGYGLVVITDKAGDEEDIMYVTANPVLIHEFCDRLEAQRDSN